MSHIETGFGSASHTMYTLEYMLMSRKVVENSQ